MEALHLTQAEVERQVDRVMACSPVVQKLLAAMKEVEVASRQHIFHAMP